MRWRRCATPSGSAACPSAMDDQPDDAEGVRWSSGSTGSARSETAHHGGCRSVLKQMAEQAPMTKAEKRSAERSQRSVAVAIHQATLRSARSSSGTGQAGPTARSWASGSPGCRPTRPRTWSSRWRWPHSGSPTAAARHAQVQLGPTLAAIDRGGAGQVPLDRPQAEGVHTHPLQVDPADRAATQLRSGTRRGTPPRERGGGAGSSGWMRCPNASAAVGPRDWSWAGASQHQPEALKQPSRQIRNVH